MMDDEEFDGENNTAGPASAERPGARPQVLKELTQLLAALPDSAARVEAAVGALLRRETEVEICKSIDAPDADLHAWHSASAAAYNASRSAQAAAQERPGGEVERERERQLAAAARVVAARCLIACGRAFVRVHAPLAVAAPLPPAATFRVAEAFRCAVRSARAMREELRGAQAAESASHGAGGLRAALPAAWAQLVADALQLLLVRASLEHVLTDEFATVGGDVQVQGLVDDVITALELLAAWARERTGAAADELGASGARLLGLLAGHVSSVLDAPAAHPVLKRAVSPPVPTHIVREAMRHGKALLDADRPGQAREWLEAAYGLLRHLDADAYAAVADDVLAWLSLSLLRTGDSERARSAVARAA